MDTFLNLEHFETYVPDCSISLRSRDQEGKEQPELSWYSQALDLIFMDEPRIAEVSIPVYRVE
jgi:hypothetical protein